MKNLLLTAIVTLILSGCSKPISETLTVVLPYEREAFTEKRMDTTLFGARSEFNSEFIAIREGVGFAKAGFQGGCGCK